MSNLILSEGFKNILNKILNKGDSKICEKLLEYEKNNEQNFNVNYIDRTDKDDFITYIQTTKLNKASINDPNIDPWTMRGREETRIGRLIRRIFGTKFDQKSVEIFVNKYKAIIRSEYEFDNFELVNGEDIKYWYHYTKYNDNFKGSLGTSCMKGDNCQRYFEIYTKNTEQIRLCILKNEKGDKIKGRAIVWNLTKPKNMILMDRIYTNDDADINLFIDFAKKNNFHCKKRQTYRGDDLLSPDGKELNDIKLEIKLNNTDFEKYPYMDTMRSYHIEDGVLKNYYDNNYDGEIRTLNDTGGYYDEYEGDYEPNYVTDWRGNDILENDALWCEFDHVYCLNTEAIRVSKGETGRGRYFLPHSEYLKYSIFSDSYYHKNDVVYSDFMKDWIYIKYAVKMYLDKDKKEWVWNHKLNLHNDMGIINDDYFINNILYRDEYEKDGEIIEGDYHFKDEEFEKLPKVDYDNDIDKEL